MVFEVGDQSGAGGIHSLTQDAPVLRSILAVHYEDVGRDASRVVPLHACTIRIDTRLPRLDQFIYHEDIVLSHPALSLT